MTYTLIITGGSRGIGKETIQYFLKNNWHVINLSRTPANIKNVINLSVDLAMPQHLSTLEHHLSTHVEKPTKIALVHNAGFLKRDSVTDTLLDTIQQTFAVNIISPMLLNTMIIPYMAAGSSIIYIGSTLAEKAVPHNASYVTSKHAIKGLMKATCQDLADKAIQTCCINPGLVETEMLKQYMTQETIHSLIQQKIIGKRLIAPEEIAKIIYFTATSTALNGATIDANLGERDS